MLNKLIYILIHLCGGLIFACVIKVGLNEIMKFYLPIIFLFFLLPEVLFAQNIPIDDKRELPKLKTESLQIGMDVDLFPNPAEEYLHVTIKNSQLKDVRIEMYNIIGNRLDFEVDKSNANTYKLNLKELHAGYYLVVVKDPISRFNKAYKFRKQ